jgi:hypothetical protein
MTEVVGWAATVYKDPGPSFPVSNKKGNCRISATLRNMKNNVKG